MKYIIFVNYGQIIFVNTSRLYEFALIFTESPGNAKFIMKENPFVIHRMPRMLLVQFLTSTLQS